MSSVQERVQKIIVEQLGVNDDQVTSEASFVDDLNADSLDLVELIMAFEEEFGIEMDEDAALSVETVGSAAEFIARVCVEQGVTTDTE